MRASVCRPNELGETERARWSSFQDASVALQNPFLSAGFADAVGHVSERARVAVLEDAGEIVGFLPYELVSRRVAGPIGRVTNNRQGFVHDARLAWTWPDVLRAAQLDMIEFGDLIGEQADDRDSLKHTTAPVITSKGGWDTFLESARRHKRVRTVLYKERRLRREFGDVDIDSGDGRCAHLGALADWKARQYRRSGWPNLFAKSWVRALLEVLADTGGNHTGANDAGAGALRVVGSSLRVDGIVVATDLSLASDSIFAGWFGAYDPAYARFSPGAVHTLHILQSAFELGATTVDLHRGDEDYKQVFMTDEVAVGTGYVALRSARSIAYQLRRMPAANTRDFVLRHPEVRRRVRESLRRVGTARDDLARRAHRDGPPSIYS